MKLPQLAIFMGLSFALGIGVMAIFQSDDKNQKTASTEPPQKRSLKKPMI